MHYCTHLRPPPLYARVVADTNITHCCCPPTLVQIGEKAQENLHADTSAHELLTQTDIFSLSAEILQV